jgi:regulator of protease activity HflC (stomatin/prohibitin superfamily)
MFISILILLLVVAGLVAILKGSVGTGQDEFSIRWIGGVLLGIAFVVFLLATIVIVPTKNVGVVTAFGRPTGTLHNGIHVVWPWESVTDYDATIQTLSTSDMHVRMVNGTATANVNVTLNWRLEGDIQQIHVDWREFSRIQTYVIQPRLQDALNKEFIDFDPLVALKQTGGKPISMVTMEQRVAERLQHSLPAGIFVDHLQLPLVVYPAVVQDALNAYQKELANTQVALQQKITAQAQKDALDILSQVRMSPEAFLQQCLIMTERLAQQGKIISQTWSCVSGSAGTVAIK